MGAGATTTMTKKDWLVLAVSAAAGGLDPVQLQKSLFLLGTIGKKYVDTTGFYGFVPHNYGPFSKEVATDADELVAQGLERSAGPGFPGRRMKSLRQERAWP